MIEQQFLTMLQNGQDALGSKQRFLGLLKDYFPKEPVIVNLMVLLYEMGIHTEIEKTGRITKNFAYRFTQRLIDKYGTERQNAENVVRMFCVCYGAKVLGKQCDLEVSKEAATKINPKKLMSSCCIFFLIVTVIVVLIVMIKTKGGQTAQDSENKVGTIASENIVLKKVAPRYSAPIIFDENWTIVPKNFKGDGINEIKKICNVLDIRKDEFESTAAYNERVEKEIAASAVSKRRYVITEEVSLKYNADKEQFEQSSLKSIEPLSLFGMSRNEIHFSKGSKFAWTEHEIHFSNRSKIQTVIVKDGWKIEKFDVPTPSMKIPPEGVRMPPIKMLPEEARKISDSTGITSLNMLYVFKIAPLPSTFVHSEFAETQNRYISFTHGYDKQWMIGASLEEIWIYDERDGRIFRKTRIN